MNKKVLRNLSYGVYAVSALVENRMSGCIANSIMQITSSPATLAVSLFRKYGNCEHSTFFNAFMRIIIMIHTDS